MRIQTIEHVPFEGPAAIANWAQEQGHTLGRSRIFMGEALPPVSEIDLLVIMGGPMSVHDEEQYPWLAEEKEYLRQAVDSALGILGICLGAQLMAEVLGGQITRNIHREIGWFPVTLTRKGQAHPLCKGLPNTFTAFHWHGETFSIPPKAQAIASSEACAHQAFALGPRMVGLQFHLETTPESMELLIDNCADELAPLTNHVQSPEVMRSTFDQPSDMDFLLKTLLNNLTKEIMK